MSEYRLIRPLNDHSMKIVVKIDGELYIPFDNENADYQDYLEWLAQGNTPKPPTEPEE